MILARLHARMKSIESKVMVTDSTGVHPATSSFPEFAAFKAQALPTAKAYVKERKLATENASDDQVILMYLAAHYREISDDQFKYAYLPFPDAAASADAAEKQLKAAKTGTFDPFVTLIPNVIAVLRGGGPARSKRRGPPRDRSDSDGRRRSRRTPAITRPGEGRSRPGRSDDRQALRISPRRRNRHPRGDRRRASDRAEVSDQAPQVSDRDGPSQR